MKHIRITTFIFAAIISVSSGSVLFNNKSVSAASAGDWNASNIIDDAVFYDNTSMSTADIQAFMNSKNPSCDTQGTRPASEYGRSDLTHAQYAASVGWPGPPYVCLRDYYQVPRSDQNINNLSTNVRPDGSISAAEIIKRASDTYGVNPKVLIVLIQKESVGPLLTDTWPIPAQYRSVVGYACPDTAPCDPKYAGFYNQIMNAAYQFKYYKDHAFDKNGYGDYIYNHQPYNTVALRFNPNASCGSTQTRIDNYATTGLYNYTPYQPNQAALNNMYGTGDGCSAYGNRNFWRMFIDWFGTVRGYSSVNTPRWMELTNDTYKKDPTTGANTGEPLASGTQLKFTSKTYINGKWYLRTEYDTTNNNHKGILLSELAEITDTPFVNPRYMELASDRKKWNPVTGYSDNSQVFKAGTSLKFVSKIRLNGTDYYRTEHDNNTGNTLYITASAVKELGYTTFEKSRYLQIKQDAHKVNPASGAVDNTVVPKGTQLFFSSKTRAGGEWFYRTEIDSATNTLLAFKASDIEEVPYTIHSEPAKWMRLKEDSQKQEPIYNTTVPGLYTQGTQIKISRQIIVEGKVYYQTVYDTQANSARVFASESVEDIPYVPMDNPRALKLSADTSKLHTRTLQKIDSTLTKGMSINFSAKITIDGHVYLRSSYDNDLNYDKVIPLSMLE